MKPIVKTEYQCETCLTTYSTEIEAFKCESMAVREDKGVKVGDVVLITRGDAQGQRARVTRVFVYDKEWGHYAWQRYWHTVGVNADIIGSPYSRQLTFDDYEVAK